MIETTKKEKEEIFQEFCNIYDELKTQLEDFFGLEIDCSLSKVVIPRIFSYITYDSRSKTIGISMESFCWPKKKIAFKHVCCHEILHAVNDMLIPELDMTDSGNFPLKIFVEGFAEYGSNNLLSHLYPQESAEVREHIINLSCVPREYSPVPFLRGRYCPYKIGYRFFLNNIGQKASKDEFLDFVLKEEFRDPTKLVEIINHGVEEIMALKRAGSLLEREEEDYLIGRKGLETNLYKNKK